MQVANLQREQPGISVSCRCFFRVFSVLQNVILTTLITAIAICGVRAPAASSEDFDRNRDNGMATIAAQDREANGEAVIQKSAAESDGPDKMDETDLSRAKQMIRKLRNKGFDESRYAEALDLLHAAIEANPQNYNAESNLVDLFLLRAGSMEQQKEQEAREMFDDAIKDLKHVVEMMPDLITAHKHLEHCYEKIGDSLNKDIQKQWILQFLETLDQDKRERYKRVLDQL